MNSKGQIFTSVLLFAEVGLGGCVEENEAVDELDLGATPEPDEPVEPVDELASGDNGATPYIELPTVECSSHNVIGVLNPLASTCALSVAPPGWSWQHMFESFTPDLAEWFEATPPKLHRFCIYEFAGVPDQDDYEQLFLAIANTGNMSLDSVAPDCRGTTVMGSGLNDPTISYALQDAFDAATQRIDGNELDGSREHARIAVIDGVSQWAVDLGKQPVNEHGLFMGDIISHIACADEDPECIEAISYHAAMVRDEYELADWYYGDEWGTMGDLAMAVGAAVRRHRLERLADPSKPIRLVINLSLGWAADDAVTTTDPKRGPVLALKEALYYATCNGALVFAASGNTSDAACGASEIGATAPATFEGELALTQAECMARGYIPLETNNYPVFGDPRPLVQAVAGLDGFDQPIANARPASLPELGAYASQVTVETPPTGFTTAQTGTSVAAAVASATAALMWANAPELTPSAIVQAMFDTAYPTGLSSDFGFAGLGQVHRLSVCNAVLEACSSAQVSYCSGISCDSPAAAPQDGYLSAFFAAVDAVINDPSTTVASFPGPQPEAPMCGPLTWDEQMDPQPDHPMCPHCKVDVPPGNGDATLSMTIDSAYAGQVASFKLVTFDDQDNPTQFVFTLPADEDVINSVNDPTVVTEVQLAASDAVTASLTFVLEDDSAQAGPIPVETSPPV